MELQCLFTDQFWRKKKKSKPYDAHFAQLCSETVKGHTTSVLIVL